MTSSQRFRQFALAAAAVLIMGLLWHQVFAMTGVLWWDAPVTQVPVERPEPPPIPTPPTGWVDVDAYLRTHPVWMP